MLDAYDHAIGGDALAVMGAALNFGQAHFDAVSHEERLAGRFDELRARWLRKVQFSSGGFGDLDDPDFQGILALGEDIVPWLVEDQLNNHVHWFDALEAITGAQPVPEEHYGDIDAMAEDWRAWAMENGWV